MRLLAKGIGIMIFIQLHLNTAVQSPTVAELWGYVAFPAPYPIAWRIITNNKKEEKDGEEGIGEMERNVIMKTIGPLPLPPL